MADRAVVVVLRRRMRERDSIQRLWTTEARDHVLMLIVWKLDRELSPWIRLSKRKSCLIPRRRFRMTDRTDLRSRAAEKLPAMTAHTRLVIRVIAGVNIRFMTRVAGLLMFLRSVRKL